MTNGFECRLAFPCWPVLSLLGKAEILSEGKGIFFRRKMEFPSDKTKFSFGQKNRVFKSIFQYTAVEFPIHCSGIQNSLLCLFAHVRTCRLSRTYVSARMNGRVAGKGAALERPERLIHFTFLLISVHSTCWGTIVFRATCRSCARLYSGMKATVIFLNCLGLTSSGVSTPAPLALPTR